MDCKICGETVTPEHLARELSFDGHGINACDCYRTRIATFARCSPKAILGPLFAAAPGLAEALRAFPHPGLPGDPRWTEKVARWWNVTARAALEKAGY